MKNPKELAEQIFDEVHESCGLVSCDTGADIGWAPEEAIPMIANFIEVRDNELCAQCAAAVRKAVLAEAELCGDHAVLGTNYDAWWQAHLRLLRAAAGAPASDVQGKPEERR